MVSTLWGQCHIYDDANKYCTIDIPELYGATCLASIEGWLLLFRGGSIFFFCPFSRAKVALPRFPHQEVSTHVATFSAPPTSQECIVAVIIHIAESKYELYVLARGAESWTKHKYSYPKQNLDTVNFALSYSGMFIFYGIVDPLFCFSVKKNCCLQCRVVRGEGDSQQTSSSSSSSNPIILPYTCYMNCFMENDMKRKLGLENDVSISVCGAILRYDNSYINVYGESIKAAEESERKSLKGVWIQPRFFQISPVQTW